MGGELPDRTQRIVAFGAAANTVHPSTGYQACRMLAASTAVADCVGRGIREGVAPDRVAGNAYRAMWGRGNRRQRDFQAFGGDFLMAQPVELLRGFFQVGPGVQLIITYNTSYLICDFALWRHLHCRTKYIKLYR